MGASSVGPSAPLYLQKTQSHHLLQRGSKGAEVLSLQNQLTAAGFPVKQDGVFGPKTEEAVKKYQEKNHLAKDGKVADQTWSCLASGGTQKLKPGTEEMGKGSRFTSDVEYGRTYNRDMWEIKPTKVHNYS